MKMKFNCLMTPLRRFAVALALLLPVVRAMAAGGVDLRLLEDLLRVKSVPRDVGAQDEALGVLKSWLETRGVFCVLERNGAPSKAR